MAKSEMECAEKFRRSPLPGACGGRGEAELPVPAGYGAHGHGDGQQHTHVCQESAQEDLALMAARLDCLLANNESPDRILSLWRHVNAGLGANDVQVTFDFAINTTAALRYAAGRGGRAG